MKTKQHVVPIAVLLAAAFAYACTDAPVAPLAPRTASQVLPAITFASTSKQISSFKFHSCALDTVSKAWCWGGGDDGDLGQFVAVDTTLPIRVAGNRSYSTITSGFYHNCAIATAGGTYCWGNNNDNELGGGTTAYESFTPVLVPGGHSFAQISAGGGHVCGVTVSNELFCWGTNGYNELGDGLSEASHTIIRIGAGRSWMAVASGDYHTCGLTTDSLAFCWGYNAQGQLGTGDKNVHITPTATGGGYHFARIAVGFINSCGLTADGAAYCWGDNSYGQLGINATTPATARLPRKVTGSHVFVDIGVAEDRACAITGAGVAYCWGGQIAGDNGFSVSQDSVPHAVETVRRFNQLAIGLYVSCARETNRVYSCWGKGTTGGLGDGGDTTAYHPVRVRRIISGS